MLGEEKHHFMMRCSVIQQPMSKQEVIKRVGEEMENRKCIRIKAQYAGLRTWEPVITGCGRKFTYDHADDVTFGESLLDHFHLLSTHQGSNQPDSHISLHNTYFPFLRLTSQAGYQHWAKPISYSFWMTVDIMTVQRWLSALCAKLVEPRVKRPRTTPGPLWLQCRGSLGWSLVQRLHPICCN